ncbi:242_t:CDS:1, partial [Gigaspora margarita]
RKVLKDNKGKVFVLEYSSRKGKRRFQKEKVVGKEKAQKIKNCQEKGCWEKGKLPEKGRICWERKGYRE